MVNNAIENHDPDHDNTNEELLDVSLENGEGLQGYFERVYELRSPTPERFSPASAALSTPSSGSTSSASHLFSIDETPSSRITADTEMETDGPDTPSPTPRMPRRPPQISSQRTPVIGGGGVVGENAVVRRPPILRLGAKRRPDGELQQEYSSGPDALDNRLKRRRTANVSSHDGNAASEEMMKRDGARLWSLAARRKDHERDPGNAAGRSGQSATNSDTLEKQLGAARGFAFHLIARRNRAEASAFVETVCEPLRQQLPKIGVRRLSPMASTTAPAHTTRSDTDGNRSAIGARISSANPSPDRGSGSHANAKGAGHHSEHHSDAQMVTTQSFNPHRIGRQMNLPGETAAMESGDKSVGLDERNRSRGASEDGHGID